MTGQIKQQFKTNQVRFRLIDETRLKIKGIELFMFKFPNNSIIFFG
jgi:hypothetical protein